MQHETLGHRGRKHDPLYRIRKLLRAGSERFDERGSQRMLLGLRVGDPHDELLGAWVAKSPSATSTLPTTQTDATTLLDTAIVGCAADDVAEVRSLGKSLASWPIEILAYHGTGASNGPNLCVKSFKRLSVNRPSAPVSAGVRACVVRAVDTGQRAPPWR